VIAEAGVDAGVVLLGEESRLPGARDELLEELVSRLVIADQDQRLDQPRRADMETTFDAGKAVMPQRALRPGAKLVGRSHLHEIYEKTGRSGRMIFLVSRMELYEGGELASIVDSRMVIRERIEP